MRIISGDEWKYRNGEGVFLIAPTYQGRPSAAILLTMPRVAFRYFQFIPRELRLTQDMADSHGGSFRL